MKVVLSFKNLFPKTAMVLLTNLCVFFCFVFECLQKWEHFFCTVQKLTRFKHLFMSVCVAPPHSFDELYNILSCISCNLLIDILVVFHFGKICRPFTAVPVFL